jgi:beta-lactam-binding protein with PASTA domain
MELKPFIKKTVQPGEPLTAQAWNDLLDGIEGVDQYLRAAMHTVRVRITTPGLDPGVVRVTASRAEGAPVEAVPPVPPGTDHILTWLEPGAWTVTAAATGYLTATASLTVGESAETTIEMALQPKGAFMPDCFGIALSQAQVALATAGIPLVRLVDFTGRELPPQNPGESAEAPVLVQWPDAGVPLPPGTGATLVIAVPIQVEAAVEVPSLAGLTQQEAQKALEAIGLVLGKVNILQKQPVP